MRKSRTYRRESAKQRGESFGPIQITLCRNNDKSDNSTQPNETFLVEFVDAFCDGQRRLGVTLNTFLAAIRQVSMVLRTEDVAIAYNADASCKHAKILKMKIGYNETFKHVKKREG